MSTTLDLNCLLFGQDRSRIFVVDVPRSKNVFALKEAVHKKMSDVLQGINATNIDLWKVSFPCDDTLERRIQDERLSDDTKLIPVKKISGIFAGTLNDEHLHIIVKAPLGHGVLSAHATCLALIEISKHTAKYD